MSLTIVVPNLNNGESILRTINGILKNKNHIKCVIVVDGNSTDGSFELLQDKLGKDTEFKCSFIQEKPNGIFAALRSGIQNVETSHFLVNLGGDELIEIPDITLSMGNLYYGVTDVIDFDNVIFSFSDPNPAFYRMPHINMNSIIWPTSDFRNSSYFKNNLKVASDFAMIFSMFANKVELNYHPGIKSSFYKDGLSSSVEMLYFGIGECLYVCYSGGSFIRSTLYALMKSSQSPVNAKYLINGFKYARRNLNAF
jgi:glycosyltransferase involved in cell wall biosynthesis